MPNDFIFWSYFLKYYMLRNISAFFLMNKLATKILVCLQYFKVLDNSIGRLKDKKDKRRIFGVHNTFKYFLSQGADPLGEIRVVMTTRTRIRFWFFGVFFELKPLLATKVICKQCITSIVFTCILHGSMSVVDNQKAYHS